MRYLNQICRQNTPNPAIKSSNNERGINCVQKLINIFGISKMRSTNAKCDILNTAEMPSMHLVKLKISTRARNSSFQENYSCNCMFEYKRHPLQLL